MNFRAAWNALWKKSAPPYAASGYGGGPAFVDAYRSRRSPTLPELVEAYKAITYACAMLNANGVARVPLRLYATTGRGQARPKCATKAIDRRGVERLRSSPTFSTICRKAVELDEVVEHPLLEALQTVNSDFDQNALIRHAVLSLDIVGSAFWLPEMNRLGVAVSLWPLQAQYVTPVQVAGESAVSEYRYFQDRYTPDQLIRARHVSVRDPHGFGYGPTQAAFEYVGLGDKYVSVQENLLGQGVRPSVIVSPKDANMPMGKDERRRFETEINARWNGPSAGRAWVIDGAIDVRPLTFPPSDLAALQISDHALQRVANCFGVPLSLLKTEDVNLANAEAGHRQHAELAIEPRCVLIASALTKWVRAQSRLNGLGWDRLFFAFDNPVAEDEERRSKVFDTYLHNGVLTINDVRPELGYDVVDWGKEPWQASSLTQPSIAAEQRDQASQADEGDEEDSDDGEDEDKRVDDDESATKGDLDEETDELDSASDAPSANESSYLAAIKTLIPWLRGALAGVQKDVNINVLGEPTASPYQDVECATTDEVADGNPLGGDAAQSDFRPVWIVRSRSHGSRSAQGRGSRRGGNRGRTGRASGRGNPYHDSLGRFTGPGGEGHADPKRNGRSSARRRTVSGRATNRRRHRSQVSTHGSPNHQRNPRNRPARPKWNNTSRFRGGPHSRTKLPWGDGLDSHHMPAVWVKMTSRERGPAIQMDPIDHRETSSYGNSDSSLRYRTLIRRMVRQGNRRGALAREIRDVRRATHVGSGDRRKCNQAMLEMLDYARSEHIITERRWRYRRRKSLSSGQFVSQGA